jgi:hypothetical protein
VEDRGGVKGLEDELTDDEEEELIRGGGGEWKMSRKNGPVVACVDSIEAFRHPSPEYSH